MFIGEELGASYVPVLIASVCKNLFSAAAAAFSVLLYLCTLRRGFTLLFLILLDSAFCSKEKGLEGFIAASSMRD